LGRGSKKSSAHNPAAFFIDIDREGKVENVMIIGYHYAKVGFKEAKMGIPVFRKEIFLCLLFLAVLVAGWAHEDEVTIKTENGVIVVYNPKNPAPPPGIPTKLVLKEELSL